MILVNIQQSRIFLFYLRTTSPTFVVIYIGRLNSNARARIVPNTPTLTHTLVYKFEKFIEDQGEIIIVSICRVKSGETTRKLNDIACRLRWLVRFSLPQSCVFYASPRNHLVTEKKRQTSNPSNDLFPSTWKQRKPRGNPTHDKARIFFEEFSLLLYSIWN